MEEVLIDRGVEGSRTHAKGQGKAYLPQTVSAQEFSLRLDPIHRHPRRHGVASSDRWLRR